FLCQTFASALIFPTGLYLEFAEFLLLHNHANVIDDEYIAQLLDKLPSHPHAKISCQEILPACEINLTLLLIYDDRVFLPLRYELNTLQDSFDFPTRYHKCVAAFRCWNHHANKHLLI